VSKFWKILKRDCTVYPAYLSTLPSPPMSLLSSITVTSPSCISPFPCYTLFRVPLPCIFSSLPCPPSPFLSPLSVLSISLSVRLPVCLPVCLPVGLTLHLIDINLSSVVFDPYLYRNLCISLIFISTSFGLSRVLPFYVLPSTLFDTHPSLLPIAFLSNLLLAILPLTSSRFSFSLPQFTTLLPPYSTLPPSPSPQSTSLLQTLLFASLPFPASSPSLSLSLSLPLMMSVLK
jgi:hypothetical protein